jgi:hypothetical protein
MTAKIYVCCHKPYDSYRNDTLEPIQLGKAITKLDCKFNYADNTGRHISAKNPYFSELTAIFWIWKNNNADIIGLFHYRRMLNLKAKHTSFISTLTKSSAKSFGLDKKNIANMLTKYDVILPHHAIIAEKNLYNHYAKNHISTDLDLTLAIIKEKHPEMYSISNAVIYENTAIYFWNILIASKSFFNEYANWLFEILFELENRIGKNVICREIYQQRVYGFIAERLLTIYIEYKKQVSAIKIKEVPLVFIEPHKLKLLRYKLLAFIKLALIKIGLNKLVKNI